VLPSSSIVHSWYYSQLSSEAPEVLLIRSLTGDPVFDLPPPVRTLAVDVVDIRRIREVGVEAVEALVRYEPVFSVAVEAVEIGRAAPPEMDLVETREVGRDVPAFPVLFVEIVKRDREIQEFRIGCVRNQIYLCNCSQFVDFLPSPNMKHGVAFRKFSRTSSHRMLMLR
jgi:hypothetical protein